MATTFINLINSGEYVNTLIDDSAYISISAHKRHRIGNHEEWGIRVSITSPHVNDSIFLPSTKRWDKIPVYGGKAVERRWSPVAPEQNAVDASVAKLTEQYRVIA